MGANWNLDKITAAFTDAAVDPTRWNAAMETACEVTKSSGAILFAIHGPSPIPVLPHSQSMLPSMDAYLREGWINRDERYKAKGVLAKKNVITEFDYTTTDGIARNAFYQEFLAPFGLRWFAGIKVACDNDVWSLSMQHSIEQGPFTKEEIKQFSDLSDKLSAVASLARMLGFAKAEAALDAFQASGSPAILTGASGKVFRVNAAAENLLGADLQIREGQLVSNDHLATAAIQRALHRLIWLQESSAPVVLPRREARPIVAYPILLPSLARDYLAPARAVVVLIDLNCTVAPAADLLSSVFGLTSGEAKLANRLCTGESLERAADTLGIAYQTARNHLKSIFTKTETNRQGELIALANRLSVPIHNFRRRT